MYGIFTNTCPKNHPNVRKYTIHGAYGIYNWYFYIYIFIYLFLSTHIHWLKIGTMMRPSWNFCQLFLHQLIAAWWNGMMPRDFSSLVVQYVQQYPLVI